MCGCVRERHGVVAARERKKRKREKQTRKRGSIKKNVQTLCCGFRYVLCLWFISEFYCLSLP